MKFLICGMGSIGLRHFRNLKTLGYEDIIIYRSGLSVMPKVDEEVKNYKVYNSLDDALLAKPDVCMVTNPTSMHIDIALKAANSGCHLYIEKPLSHNLENIVNLQKIVKAKKLVTFITYQFRFHPHIVKLKKIIEKKSYGNPLYVTTEWSEYLPDWHPWEDYKRGYSARKDLGGGVLLTQIHPINYLNFIFGDIEKVQINKVMTKSLDIEVDDVADMLINFKSGVSGHVHIDFLQKPRVHTMKILTTKGRFEWDYHKNELIFIDRNSVEEIFNINSFDRNNMFTDMLQDFIDCIRLNNTTRFNLDQAIVELKSILDNE